MNAKVPFPRPMRARAMWAGLAAAVAGLALIPPSGAMYEPTYQFLERLPLNEFFSTCEQLAGPTALISIGLVILLFDRPRRRWLVVFLMALALAGGLNEIIKRTTGRARPQYSVKLDERRERRLLEYIAEHPGTAVRVERRDHWLLIRSPRPWFMDAYASFPSGHTNTAFVLLAFLLVMYPRGRWLWVVLCFGCALARVRFRRHYPSDVLFGGALGWMMAQWVFSWGWPERLARRLMPDDSDEVQNV